MAVCGFPPSDRPKSLYKYLSVNKQSIFVLIRSTMDMLRWTLLTNYRFLVGVLLFKNLVNFTSRSEVDGRLTPSSREILVKLNSIEQLHILQSGSTAFGLKYVEQVRWIDLLDFATRISILSSYMACR